MKPLSALTLLGKTGVLVALLLSGCTQKNDPAPARPACKVVTASFSNGTTDLVSRFTYDGEDRIKEMVTSNGTRKLGSVSYEYNPQGQLSKQTNLEYGYDAQMNEKTTTRTFTVGYNAKGQAFQYQGVVTSTDPTVPQGTYTYACEYDSQGNRTKVTITGSSGAPSVYLYEYRDGNCTKATYRAGEANESSIAYEYYLDRENKSRTTTPLSLLNAPANKNWVKKYTETYKNSPGGSMTVENTYEFNNQGFPLKTTATARFNNGSPSVAISTFEYACR
jgi:major membrane immunogen (membrane-anchored lipoprotein)